MSPSAPAVLEAAFRNRRVLVTGHTGFKGAWLSEWLLALGAQVHGFALEPPTSPSLFGALGLAGRVARHRMGDVRDAGALREAVAQARPDFVFHLAAQPLVRKSYEDPAGTFAVNVLGTVHVLEAVRAAGSACAVVAVTTDKCYENREWLHGYREEDPLGGRDPYSASKAAAEIAIACWRRSFFSGSPGEAGNGVRLASARAGNVMGGGDWAEDRIVPDCVRALQDGRTIGVRNPSSTRPWQHVLEPLSGYLWLAACLDQPARARGGPADEAFNFGPGLPGNRSVEALVAALLRRWPGAWEDLSGGAGAPHEAGRLDLAIDKAWHRLGWRPAWDFETCVEETVRWYRAFAGDPAAAARITREQIGAYAAAARDAGAAWAA